MAKTFDGWHALAKTIYDDARDMDRDQAVMEIVKNLVAAYSEGGLDAIDKMQDKLGLRRTVIAAK